MRTLTATIAAALGCILTAQAQVAVSPGYTPYMATVFLATNSTHARSLLELSGTATNLAAGATGADLTLSGDLSGTNATFSGTLDAVTIEADQVNTALFVATNTAFTYGVTTTQPVLSTTNWQPVFCGGEITNSIYWLAVTNNVNLQDSTNKAAGRYSTLFLQNNTGSNVMVNWNTNWHNMGASHPPVTFSNGLSMQIPLMCVGADETNVLIGFKQSMNW